MLKSVEGIFRNGKVELLEPAPQAGESRVLVTFLQNGGAVNLPERGIDEDQAADLRNRLGAIAEDWQRPAMDVYDEM
ncbi:MAG TPA: hypothetical protein VGQ99_14320 [Tepidisphaeraceae bacterium]|jgi:hypothetical protein|nr:hypothetical protein [Tepidisphaeraceae bacterium]